jgi:predicted TIM-barrel fold metal-dependent hydrolase
VLAHTWGGSRYDGVEEARKIAEKYPDLVLICGHSFHGDWDNGLSLSEFPNVYYELTAVFDDRGVIERIASKAGSGRMLFGTDLPWFSTHHGVGALLSADITDEDRHNIMHRNGERLLGRFG